MRSDRLLATLLLLQSHGRLPAPEIARRLEVSRRTVSRDVEALSAAGVPVYCERGRNGGVALLEGYRTDVTGMTDEELRALVALGASADGGALGSSLASASRKLLAALPEARRAGVDRARRRLLVEHQGWRRAPEELPALPALDAALVADERVRLQYATGDAAHATWRTVDPYGLVSKAGTWYLVAAHRGRPKMYRVSRVRAVAATGTPARRPDERDLAEVWTELRERLETPTAEVEVRLLVDPAWAPTLRRVHLAVLAGPWRNEGVAPDGREILVAPFRSLVGARAGLLGYGEAVEVLEPAALREEMADAAARVVAMYTRSSLPESSPPDRPARLGSRAMTTVLVTGGGERLAEVAKAIEAAGAETTVVDTLDRLGEAVGGKTFDGYVQLPVAMTPRHGGSLVSRVEQFLSEGLLSRFRAAETVLPTLAGVGERAPRGWSDQRRLRRARRPGGADRADAGARPRPARRARPEPPAGAHGRARVVRDGHRREGHQRRRERVGRRSDRRAPGHRQGLRRLARRGPRARAGRVLTSSSGLEAEPSVTLSPGAYGSAEPWRYSSHGIVQSAMSPSRVVSGRLEPTISTGSPICTQL